jgi:hypothetical protein
VLREETVPDRVDAAVDGAEAAETDSMLYCTRPKAKL